MKKHIVGLIPLLLLLTGCSDTAAERTRKQCEAIKNITSLIEERKNELDALWSAIPPEVKTNVEIKNLFGGATWNINHLRQELSQPLVDANTIENAKRSLFCMAHDKFPDLDLAAKALTLYKEARIFANDTEVLIDKLCSGNLRARFHLREAVADLERAATSGYCPRLVRTAERHICIAQHLAKHPLEPVEFNATTCIRDRLWQMESSQSQRTNYQAAHLTAARQCLETQREALALAGNKNLLLQMATEHLARASDSQQGCKQDKGSHSKSDDIVYVDVLEQVLITELFINASCPENQEAKTLIGQARAIYQAWRQRLTSEFWVSGEMSKVRAKVTAARTAIAEQPREGSR